MQGRGADCSNAATAFVNLLSVHALAAVCRVFGRRSRVFVGRASPASETVRRPCQLLNMFAGPLDTEWFQSVPPPKLAPATLAFATVDALHAGIKDAYVGDIAQEVRAHLKVQPKALKNGTRLMSALAAWAALATGTVRMIDPKHTLTPEFPTIVMPRELGQCAPPFRMEEVSRHDERRPA
jgi:hypothetical protein